MEKYTIETFPKHGTKIVCAGLLRFMCLILEYEAYSNGIEDGFYTENKTVSYWFLDDGGVDMVIFNE